MNRLKLRISFTSNLALWVTVFLALCICIALGQQPAGTYINPSQQQQKPPSNHHHHHSHTPQDQRVDRVEMMRHSFQSPLSYDNDLEEWELDMASIPVREHVVLLPAVANRTGTFWNKSPVKTTNWEVQFQFAVKGRPQATPFEGFAFWYSLEPYTPVKVPAERAERNFFGYKSNPKGLGVFFAAHDNKEQLNPTITAGYFNGEWIVNKKYSVPTKSGVYYNFRNQPEALTFKLSVGPKGVRGMIQQGSGQWTECFMINQTLPAGGYIGLTGFGGQPLSSLSEAEAIVGDSVWISSLEMWNLDLNTPGEDAAVMKGALNDVDVGDILRDHSHVKDQRDHTEALKQLTRMLYKHISEAAPREQTIIRTLNSLMTSVHKMLTKLAELQSEVRTSHTANHTESLHSMKSDLLGLRNMFHRHSQQQSNTLSSLHSALASGSDSSKGTDVRELVQKAASLENTIKSHTSFSSYITLGLLASVIVFAGLMWKRMREMEKKHFL